MSPIAVASPLAHLSVVGLGLIVACASQNDLTEQPNPFGVTPMGGASTRRSSSTAAAVAPRTKGDVTAIDVTGSGASSGVGEPAAAHPGDSLNSCSPQPDDSGCVGAAYEAESMVLDILIMFDLSCSMSCTVDQSGCCALLGGKPPESWRIQPVRSAMRTFLQDSGSAGIGVGLSFFGNHSLLAFMDPTVCSIAHYAQPVIEIAPLPSNASTLISALDAGSPEGGTPTPLAIDGACVHATDWRAKNPGHKVVTLLVTDGIPEVSCGATIQLAVDASARCFDGGRGVATYVLGISSNNNGQGSSLSQLNEIAVAGGTNQAYLTSTTDVAGSVLTALNAIRADAAIPCDLAVPQPPPGQSIAPNKINIGICTAGAQPAVTPYVHGVSDCQSGIGWYYDNADSPRMIHLCESTCRSVSQPGASLFFSVGCSTADANIIL